MRSLLYTFSSRIASSAFIWAALLIAAIEMVNAGKLPGKCISHEVDQLLYDLDHKSFQAPVLFMGDSVGRQIGNTLRREKPDVVVSLACNAAVESAGQYFVFQRYIEHNPMPRKVILMMGNPLLGDLDSVYTENFVERCFLRWSEILGLVSSKKDPVFSCMMIAYKCFPSLRYRLHIQKKIPGIKIPDIYSGGLNLAETGSKGASKTDYGLMKVIKKCFLKKTGYNTLSACYFEKLVGDLNRRGVKLVFVFPPLEESRKVVCKSSDNYGRQFAIIDKLSKQYSQFSVAGPVLFFPNEWFSDGVHLKEEYRERVASEYMKFLEESP